MTTEQWTDRSTGERRSKSVVKVERLALLGSRADNAAAQGPAGPGTTAAQPAGASSAAAPPPLPPPPSWNSGPLSEEEVPF
jgi:single-strand DNA-binding protein